MTLCAGTLFPVVRHEDCNPIEEVAEVLASKVWPEFGGYLVKDFYRLAGDTFATVTIAEGPDSLIVPPDEATDRAPEGSVKSLKLYRKVARRALEERFGLAYEVGVPSVHKRW